MKKTKEKDGLGSIIIKTFNDSNKIIVFGDDLYANISGESIGATKDLVIITAVIDEIGSYRLNWRENF